MGRVVTNDRLEVVCCLFFGTHHVLLCLFGGRKHNKTNQRRKRRRSLSHTRRQTTWQRSLVSTFRCIYTHTHTHTISLLRLSGGVKNFSLSLLSNQSSSGDECTTSVVRTHFRGIHPQTLLIITCMYTHNTRRGYPAHVSDRMTTVCVCVYVPQYWKSPGNLDEFSLVFDSLSIPPSWVTKASFKRVWFEPKNRTQFWWCISLETSRSEFLFGE